MSELSTSGSFSNNSEQSRSKSELSSVYNPTGAPVLAGGRGFQFSDAMEPVVYLVAHFKERIRPLLPSSRLHSAGPSVWISSGRIAPVPFEVGPNAQEVPIWEVDQPRYSGQIPPPVPSS